MTLDKVKDRIRKLLAVAGDDAATPGEKSNAMRFASAMMRKHNLERNDVENESEFIRVNCAGHGRRITKWESTVAYVVGRVVPSVMVVKWGDQIAYVGTKADAELAALIYSNWSDTAHSNAVRKYGSWARGKGASYCLGFAGGLNEVVDEAEAKDKTEHGNAMIVSNARALTIRNNARQWIAKTNKIGKQYNNRKSTVDRGAYNAGVQDGRNQSAPSTQQQPRLA